MPVRMEAMAGTPADRTRPEALINGIDPKYLLTDREYDQNRALAAARARGDGAGDTAKTLPEVAGVLMMKRCTKRVIRWRTALGS